MISIGCVQDFNRFYLSCQAMKICFVMVYTACLEGRLIIVILSRSSHPQPCLVMDPVARAVNSQLHLRKHRRFLLLEKFKKSGGELKDKYLQKYMKLRFLVFDENVSL